MKNYIVIDEIFSTEKFQQKFMNIVYDDDGKSKEMRETTKNSNQRLLFFIDLLNFVCQQISV